MTRSPLPSLGKAEVMFAPRNEVRQLRVHLPAAGSKDREGTMPFMLISVRGSYLPANFSPTSPVGVDGLTKNTQDF